jgi:hypothetical protein
MSRSTLEITMIALLLTTTSLSACGGESGPMTPEGDVPEVAGGWEGTAIDTYDDEQTVSVFLEQDGTEVTGSIASLIFRTVRPFALAGTVDEDGRVEVEVLAADSGGCFDVTVSLSLNTSGTRLEGGYVIDRKAEGCGRPQLPEPVHEFTLYR